MFSQRTSENTESASKLSLAKSLAEETKEGLSLEETQGLLQRLRIHEIELQMQNDALRRTQRELEASRERFLELYDRAPVGYFTLNEEGVIQEVNLTAAALLSTTKSALIGNPLADYIVARDRDVYCQHRSQLLETGMRGICEFRMLRRNEEPFWARVELHAVFDVHGSRYCRAILSDISDIKNAEEGLRILETAFRSTAHAIVITGRDAAIQWINEAFTRLTGYSADDVFGQTPRLLNSSLQNEAFYKNLWEVIQSGRSWQGELINKRKDGSLYNEEMMVTPVMDAHGEITHFIAIKKDVTLRKQVEEQLRLQSLMLDSVGQAVAAADLNNCILFWNKTAANMFGWSREEALGRMMSEVLPMEVSPEETEIAAAAFKRGECWSGELNVRRRDGRLIPMLITNAPVLDDRGKIIAIIGIGVDLTDLRRIQDALCLARNELELKVQERTAELVATNAALLREMTERQSLEARILKIAEDERLRIGQDLHDGLCQQLAGITYLCSVAKDRLVQKAPDEVVKLNHIIQLLRETNDQARSVARGLYPVSLQPDGLMVALQRLVGQFKLFYPMAIQFDCPGKVLINDNAVATHLYRIAQEAMSNAAKHSKGTEISIRLEDLGDSIMLTVQDDGQGLPDNRQQANGMGLETMHYRARSTGANLKIKSAPNQGTVLTCNLPIPTHR